MVDAQKSVTFAFVMGSVADFGLAAEITKPDVIFKNDSFKDRKGEIVGRARAKEIRIIRDVIDHSSTTDILKEAARIASRNP